MLAQVERASKSTGFCWINIISINVSFNLNKGTMRLTPKPMVTIVNDTSRPHQALRASESYSPKTAIKSSPTCKYCDKEFNSKNDLKHHVCSVLMDTSTESQQLYECCVCRKQFMRENYLVQHMENHNNQMDYHSSHCNAESRSVEERNLHGNFNCSTMYKWQCLQCLRKCSTEHDLERHKQIHQWIDSLDGPFDCTDSNLIFQSIKCVWIFPSKGTRQTNDRMVQPSKKDAIQLEHCNQNGMNVDTESNDSADDLGHISISSTSVAGIPSEQVSQLNGVECEERSSSDQNHKQRVNNIKCSHCVKTFHTIDERLKHECQRHMPRVVLNHIQDN